ncbi:8144_t:CDS:1, partial [Racocetra persica]
MAESAIANTHLTLSSTPVMITTHQSDETQPVNDMIISNFTTTHIGIQKVINLLKIASLLSYSIIWIYLMSISSPFNNSYYQA